MDDATAQALADGYVAYTSTGDLSIMRMFSPDFFDNVSGRRGLGIFTVVGGWLEESFAERSAELHGHPHPRHRDDVVHHERAAHRERLPAAQGVTDQGQHHQLAAGAHLPPRRRPGHRALGRARRRRDARLGNRVANNTRSRGLRRRCAGRRPGRRHPDRSRRGRSRRRPRWCRSASPARVRCSPRSVRVPPRCSRIGPAPVAGGLPGGDGVAQLVGAGSGVGVVVSPAVVAGHQAGLDVVDADGDRGLGLGPTSRPGRCKRSPQPAFR